MNTRVIRQPHTQMRLLRAPGFLLATILLLLTLFACSGIPISYYDATTYSQLTSLKAEATYLVESFDTKPVAQNQAAIDKVMMDFRKAYEYEYGKGNPNSDTTEQFKIIQGLFDSDVKDYKEAAPQELGKNYFQEASVVLGQAFDIAIATENLKNKDKR